MPYRRDYRLHDASADAPEPLSTLGRWRETTEERWDPAKVLALVFGIGVPLALVVYVIVALLFG